MSLADYAKSVAVPRVDSPYSETPFQDERQRMHEAAAKANALGQARVRDQACEPAAEDLSNLFFAALFPAMEREGCDAAVLVGLAECGRALPWREEYQTFGNGRRLEEAESPPFCGADVLDAAGVLVRAQAAAVAKAAKERRAVALVFRRGVVCQFERRAASFEPQPDDSLYPDYRPPGVSVRTRVAFVRSDSRVGG